MWKELFSHGFFYDGQPVMFKRNAKDERTMAHIFCKYFQTLFDDIRPFVSLFKTNDSYPRASIKDCFANENE